MSLAVANNIMDSGEHQRLAIMGQDKIAEGNLYSKESTEKFSGDVHDVLEGISGLRETKTITDLGKGVYKAGGPVSFVTQEAGKTAAAAGKTAGKVAAGAQAASEAIQNTAKQVALGSTSTQVAARQSLTTTQTAAKTTDTAASDAAKVANIGKDADAAGGTLLDAVKGIGKTSMGLVGAVPGAIDAFQDITHGKIEGGTTGAQWANGLTIAGTVLDFIPGLEWAGALTGGVAAGLSVKENIDKQKQQTADNAAADKANHAPLPSVQSWSHMGLVSSLSSDASQHISGGGHF